MTSSDAKPVESLSHEDEKAHKARVRAIASKIAEDFQSEDVWVRTTAVQELSLDGKEWTKVADIELIARIRGAKLMYAVEAHRLSIPKLLGDEH